MVKSFAVLLLFTAAPLLAHATTTLPGNAALGEKLYHAQCAACHASRFGGDGSVIFIRKGRHVHSIKGLYRQVDSCSTQIEHKLSSSQRHDIVKYLDDKYYKF